MDFDLTDEEILGLSVDELGLRLLEDFAATAHTIYSNVGNWMGGFKQNLRNGRPSQPTIEALDEAWHWLFTRNLLAPAFERYETPYTAVVTRLGRRVLSEGPESAKAAARLDIDLHPLIERKAKSPYLQGNFDRAVFDAMRAVEIRVRELSGEPSSADGKPLIGVGLMQQVFGERGPLRSPAADPGERRGRMDLFAGAMANFKNPGSHREIHFDDPTEAAEVILLADLLMRILDRVEEEVEDRQRTEAAQQFGKALAEVIHPPKGIRSGS